MPARRIVPCLDVADGRVVKGVQFRDHRDVGDIVDFALRYRDDYAAGGFRMLPNVADGDRRTRAQAVLFAAMLLPISLLPILPSVSRARWAYGIGAIVLGVLFLRAAIRCANRRPDAEKKLFLTSIAYLPLLLAVLTADQ